MLQVDERFNLVNLEALKESVSPGSDEVSTILINLAIKEIEMHRKFNKDYGDYLRFTNEARNA